MSSKSLKVFLTFFAGKKSLTKISKMIQKYQVIYEVYHNCIIEQFQKSDTLVSIKTDLNLGFLETKFGVLR